MGLTYLINCQFTIVNKKDFFFVICGNGGFFCLLKSDNPVIHCMGNFEIFALKIIDYSHEKCIINYFNPFICINNGNRLPGETRGYKIKKR